MTKAGLCLLAAASFTLSACAISPEHAYRMERRDATRASDVALCYQAITADRVSLARDEEVARRGLACTSDDMLARMREYKIAKAIEAQERQEASRAMQQLSQQLLQQANPRRNGFTCTQIGYSTYCD